VNAPEEPRPITREQWLAVKPLFELIAARKAEEEPAPGSLVDPLAAADEPEGLSR